MTGSALLVRMILRRDRIVLPLWVLVLGLVPTVYAVSFRDLYPTAQDRLAFYEATSRIPSQLALVGPIFGSDPGALVAWRAGIVPTLAAVATVLTVVRHTRSEEDAGRTELIGSTAVGRYAAVWAALVVAVGGVLAVGVVTAGSLTAFGLPAAGSGALGLGFAAAGAVFAAVAAVSVQLARSARVARGCAMGVVAAAFVVRAVGDSGAEHVSWFSPLGWSAQIRPFAGDRWWVLALPTLLAVAVGGSALLLAGRRDLGAGMLAERRGRGRASRSLAGPVSLAWRTQRGVLGAWVIGTAVLAAVTGAAAGGIEDQLGGSVAVSNALARFGGTTLVQSHIATIIAVVGLLAAAYTTSAVLRLHAEEEDGLAAATLSGGVGRVRWASGHLAVAVGGPVLVTTVAGVVIGATARTPDVGIVDAVGAAAVQLPAIWVLTAVGVLLLGGAPRFAPAAWAVLAVVVLLGQVGAVIGLPQPLLDLSPFTHVPHLPGGPIDPVPIAVLLTLAIGTGALGLVAVRRRDVMH